MSIWKDKKAKWRFSLFYRGKRICTKAGYATKAEAERGLAQARVELEAQLAKQERQERDGIDFKDFANKYLEFSERRHTLQTHKYKFFVFKSFLEAVGNMPIKTITPITVENYLKTRSSNHNYNVHRKELSALFNWGIKRAFLTSNPCAYIDRLPVEKARKIIPTPEEIGRLFLVAGEDRPFLQVLYYTLARVDEVLRLEWEHVDFNNKVVLLGTRKRANGEMAYDAIPMGNELCKVLQSLYRHRKSDQWVFFNPVTQTRYYHRPKLMRNLCRKAGIRHFGFHAIRHYVASQLRLNPQVNTLTISKLLRHTNLRTTEIYLHSIGEELRDAIAQLPRPDIHSNQGIVLSDFK